MQSPDISVIVPCYNAEKYLPECLKSLQNQEKPNIEMILIDDGSTDNTGRILDEFSGQENRARVFHIANGGVSQARNLGLEKASGEYIAFLDADDLYEPDALRILWDNVQKTEAQIVSGAHSVLTEKEVAPVVPDSEGDCPEKVVRKIIHMHRIYNNVWNKLYRRTLFTDKVRFDPSVRIGEDALVNLQLYAMADKTVQLEENTYLYRVHGNSAMSKAGNYRDAHLPMLNAMNSLLQRYQIKEVYFRDFLLSAVWIYEKESGILYIFRIFNREIRPLILSGELRIQKINRQDRILFALVRSGLFPLWYMGKRMKKKLNLSGGKQT